MANSRKDHKGRKLREGERWRKDGRYSYRYTYIRIGKRLTVYARDLPELRDVQILPSHIKSFYSKLSKAGYAYSTIKFIENMICPALEMAVDDDIIRKNPADRSCLVR